MSEQKDPQPGPMPAPWPVVQTAVDHTWTQFGRTIITVVLLFLGYQAYHYLTSHLRWVTPDVPSPIKPEPTPAPAPPEPKPKPAFPSTWVPASPQLHG